MPFDMLGEGMFATKGMLLSLAHACSLINGQGACLAV